MMAIIGAALVVTGLLMAAGVFSSPELPRREEVKERLHRLGIR